MRVERFAVALLVPGENLVALLFPIISGGLKRLARIHALEGQRHEFFLSLLIVPRDTLNVRLDRQPLNLRASSPTYFWQRSML